MPQTKVRQSREESRRRIVDAAAELVRERSYTALTVDELMSRAGIGRTLFYRHFDDLGEVLMRAGREAIEELFAAQETLARGRDGYDAQSIREALAAAVGVYRRHGPVLRAVAEAAIDDERIAAGQDAIRRRFDELVASALRDSASAVTDPDETARALNLLNENYLREAFGGEPRVSEEVAARTLTEIWLAVVEGTQADDRTD